MSTSGSSELNLGGLRAEVERTKEILRAQGVVISEFRAEVERLGARVECAEANHETVLDQRDALRERLELFMPLYEELKGCRWIREDGQENKLAVAMANLERTLENAQ